MDVPDFAQSVRICGPRSGINAALLKRVGRARYLDLGFRISTFGFLHTPGHRKRQSTNKLRRTLGAVPIFHRSPISVIRKATNGEQLIQRRFDFASRFAFVD
jgi:hypothetical protein